MWYQQIKSARVSKDLTQKKMSEILGITDRSYRYIEAGKQWPPYEKLEKICETLGITITIGNPNTAFLNHSSGFLA